MDKLLNFLDDLDNRKIYYRINRVRDSILVEVAVPGQRWEVEFGRDGDIQIERFMSEGVIWDETVIERLLCDFSD